MNRSIVAFFGLTLSFAMGCGDSGSSTGGGDTGGTGGTGAAGAAGGEGGSGGSGAAGGGVECEEPEGTPGPVNDVEVASVDVTVTDQNGDPVADEPLLLCGVDLCSVPVTSDAAGEATLVSPADTLDRPLVKPNNSLNFAKVGYSYESGTTLSGIFPRIVNSDSAMTAGATVEAGGASLTIPEGGVVVIDELIYLEAPDQTFRGVVVDDQAVVSQIAGAGFALIVGLGPVDTIFCPGASLSVPNDAGLGANTAVEVLGQELSVFESFGPYGQWNVIAEGVVSADGSTIEIADLPVLQTIAIRIKN